MSGRAEIAVNCCPWCGSSLIIPTGREMVSDDETEVRCAQCGKRHVNIPDRLCDVLHCTNHASQWVGKKKRYAMCSTHVRHFDGGND